MLKVIIFDFDDTMYVGEEWEGWSEYLHDIFLSLLKNESEYLRFKGKYGLDLQTETKGVIQIIKNEGLSVEDAVSYIDNHMYKHDVSKLKFIPNEFYEELKQKFPLYIVSMGMQGYIKHYLKKFNIKEDNFCGIYTMNIIDEAVTKGALYTQILEMEKIEPSEALVIGNSWKNDIVPAIENNIPYLFFDGDFNTIYKYFEENDILDCGKYRK